MKTIKLKKDGTPYKTPDKPGHLDKLVKSGFYTTLKTKKNPARKAEVSLWEIWRKNAYGEITLRGYEVRSETGIWYFGPCYYDKVGDANSCINMANRKFNNPNEEAKQNHE